MNKQCPIRVSDWKVDEDIPICPFPTCSHVLIRGEEFCPCHSKKSVLTPIEYVEKIIGEFDEKNVLIVGVKNYIGLIKRTDMKECRRCKKTKDLSQFRQSWYKSVGKYYYRSYCKNCLTKFNNERRQKTPRLRAKKNIRSLLYYYRHADEMNRQRQERRKTMLV